MVRDLAPRPGSMLANRSPNKTRALSCRKITRGLARGGNTTEGGFLLDTHSPNPNNCDHRNEARARLGRGNTEAKEPRARFSPGVP